VGSARSRLTHCFAIIFRTAAMLDMILGGVTAAFLLGYLVFALLRPERL
jgi:K+-transporting ATPase KdpF subunit